MRVFLIVFSFINALLYFVSYAYYDNILAMFGAANIGAGILSFTKLMVLLIFSFLIGLIVSFLSRTKYERDFFDLRVALIAGMLPFIFLILSQGNIMGFLTVNVFGSGRQISEFIFYFLSRQAVWVMWLGFVIGASVKIAFKKKLKHVAGPVQEKAIDNENVSIS
jgi:hypothetical protein